MVTCTECNKTFRKESGLSWHLEHIHGAALAEPESQVEGLEQATEQQPGELESRLEKLERVTGLRESELDVFSLETTLPEQLAALREQVTKLAGEVEQARASEAKADADKDHFNKRVEGLQRKFDEELNSLAAVVNIHRDAFNRECAALESRIDGNADVLRRAVERYNGLHVCPDCGASLHLHRASTRVSSESGKFVVEGGSWHLECVLCGYYSPDYKATVWKEKAGNHPIPVKQEDKVPVHQE